MKCVEVHGLFVCLNMHLNAAAVQSVCMRICARSACELCDVVAGARARVGSSGGAH